MYLSRAIAQKRQIVRPQANFATIPAPIAGWNVRDSLEAMDPRFATILDNYIPRTGYVGLRQGNFQHADTGEAGDVESLHEFRGSTFGGTVDRKLLAAAGDKIFDVTTSTPSTLGSGFVSAQWIGENFNSLSFLCNSNASDPAQQYDGTTLSNVSFTFSPSIPASPTINDLVYPHQSKNRMWFVLRDSAMAVYGDVNAISGTLNPFDFSLVSPNSGKLKAIGTLTLDGGDLGIDDIMAFVMDSGDVLLYAGTDPAAAANWQLIGRFRVGAPIGHKPIAQYGPDLIMITPTGYIPVGMMARQGRADVTSPISDTIIGAVKEATALYQNNFGWNIQLFPAEQLLIVNIPTGSGCEQHVMNTSTQAWCRWTGMGAKSSALLNEELYLGCVGGVVRKYGGGSDFGNPIIGDAQTAWNDFGRQGLNKRVVMYRPIMSSNGPLAPAMGVGVDFQDATVSSTVPTQTGSAGQWDVGLWDQALWGGGTTFIRSWKSTNARGDHIAVRIRTETTGQFPRLYSTDVQYLPGGPR